MLQSKLLFIDNQNDRGFRDKDPFQREIKYSNSTCSPEEEGVTATSSDQRPSRGGISIIHRVPLVEGATATSSDILFVGCGYIKINRKNAPNELFLVLNKTNQNKGV